MYRSTVELIATAANAQRNCATGYLDYWRQVIEWVEKQLLPTGSGFDCGTRIEEDSCDLKKVVLSTSFHHMNDHGLYNGWSGHKVIVTPTFNDFDLKVTGRNLNNIKEDIGEIFANCLSDPAMKQTDDGWVYGYLFDGDFKEVHFDSRP